MRHHLPAALCVLAIPALPRPAAAADPLWSLSLSAGHARSVQNRSDLAVDLAREIRLPELSADVTVEPQFSLEYSRSDSGASLFVSPSFSLGRDGDNWFVSTNAWASFERFLGDSIEGADTTWAGNAGLFSSAQWSQPLFPGLSAFVGANTSLSMESGQFGGAVAGLRLRGGPWRASLRGDARLRLEAEGLLEEDSSLLKVARSRYEYLGAAAISYAWGDWSTGPRLKWQSVRSLGKDRWSMRLNPATVRTYSGTRSSWRTSVAWTLGWSSSASPLDLSMQVEWLRFRSGLPLDPLEDEDHDAWTADLTFGYRW